MKDEFHEVDIDKVIKMCVIHDLEEVFADDIPMLIKTGSNERTGEKLLYN